MGKIIFMALIALLAWVFFKKRAVQPPKPNNRAATDASSLGQNTAKSASKPASIERMVACATCGVFMPESDSVLSNGIVSCRDPAHCAHRHDQPRG